MHYKSVDINSSFVEEGSRSVSGIQAIYKCRITLREDVKMERLHHGAEGEGAGFGDASLLRASGWIALVFGS